MNTMLTESLEKLSNEEVQVLSLNWLTDERQYQTLHWGSIEDRPQSLPGYIVVMESLINDAKKKWMEGYEGTSLIKLAQASAVGLASMEQFETAKHYSHTPGPRAFWRGRDFP